MQSDFKDAGYEHNLVGLAKESVSCQKRYYGSFGIEADIEGQRQSILFDSTRDELNEMDLPLDVQSVPDEYRITDDRETVVGVLQHADATKDLVKLLTDEGKWWQIVVLEGLAEDLVKPYFGDRVQVEGRDMIRAKKTRRLYLHDIRAADDNTRPMLQAGISLLNG